jgi:hypothetical protein
VRRKATRVTTAAALEPAKATSTFIQRLPYPTFECYRREFDEPIPLSGNAFAVAPVYSDDSLAVARAIAKAIRSAT